MENIEKKSLSSLDLFGLVSGIVGIIAGAVSLSVLFGLTKASLTIPFPSWFTTFILVVYGSLIAGFYSRRLLFNINKQKISRIGAVDYERVEQAATVATCVITGTLCLIVLFLIGSYISQQVDQSNSAKKTKLTEKYGKTKATITGERITSAEEKKALKEELVSLEKQYEDQVEEIEKEGSSSRGLVWFLTSLIGLVISVVFTMAINALSVFLYRGCDPDYEGSLEDI